jgi:hypothetical protein
MQLKEARELLDQLVELELGAANTSVTLGIVALRDNDPDAVQGSLK